jgi:hypothetical protein
MPNFPESTGRLSAAGFIQLSRGGTHDETTGPRRIALLASVDREQRLAGGVVDETGWCPVSSVERAASF